MYLVLNPPRPDISGQDQGLADVGDGERRVLGAYLLGDRVVAEKRLSHY